MSDKSLTHGGGESYCGILPTKQLNKSDQTPAEAVEERPKAKENTQQPNLGRTPSRENRKSGLERVREAAKKNGKLKFTALLHHVSIDLLRDSYNSLKKQAAPGVDGMTWEEYGQDLEARLADLHGRIHRGAYRALPSRRVWIPKADGRQRPLGSRHWKIRSSSTRWERYSTRYGKRTFWASATDSGVLQALEPQHGIELGCHAFADRCLRKRMHARVPGTAKWLQQVVSGYFQYHVR